LDADSIAQACAQSMWRSDACSQALGMKIIQVGPGFASLSLQVRDDMLNGQRICHGGILFTLADSAFAFACNTYNQFVVAQHCNVSFLQPVYQNECLTAVASERHRAKRSGIYDVVISRGEEDVVAEFRGFSRTVSGQHVADLEPEDPMR